MPLSEMAKDMLNSYKYGWKTVYYQNTYDSKVEDEILEEVTDIVANDSYEDFDDDGCESGACAI